jgi:small subunit ribosomal protein S13
MEEKRMEDKKAKGKERKEGVPPSESEKKEKVSRGIVRVAGRDLKGELPIRRAICDVKGIGANLGSILSDKVADELGIERNMPIGNLSEKQIDSLEQIISNPAKFGIPRFLLNRRKDPVTGEDRHLVGGDLAFATKQTIEHEKDIFSWRGYRHAFGQKVRGQRTRTSGRRGMTVGVLRKSVLEKAGRAAATEKEEKKEKK